MRGKLTRTRLSVALILVALVVIVVAMGRRSSGPGAETPTAALPGPASSAAVDLGSLPTATPVARPARCHTPSPAQSHGAWVVPWMEDASQIQSGKQHDLLPEQARQLELLDFFWLNLGDAPGRIRLQAEGPQARTLDAALKTAADANPCALRFVTLVDSAADGNRQPQALALMARILLDPAARRQHVQAVAQTMAHHPLADGLTLDYEFSLPQTRAELERYYPRGTLASEVDQAAQGYTELVRELGQAMARQHRLLRVTAPVRSDDDINPDYLKPYLFNYGQLAQAAQQVVLMAYDYHWAEGPEPGPIAPMADVRRSVAFALSHQGMASKLTVGLPAYGYDWSVGAGAQRPAAELDATQLAAKAASGHWQAASGSDGEVHYRYRDDQGHPHEVWAATSGLATKVQAIKPACHCGFMVWKVGNTDPDGSAAVLQALH